MSEAAEAVTPASGGIVLTVRLTPRAARDGIDGIRTVADGREVLAVRVRAVPEKGAANEALEMLVARALAVPKSCVRVVAGHKERLKTVHIEGETATLLASAARLAEGGQT